MPGKIVKNDASRKQNESGGRRRVNILGPQPPLENQIRNRKPKRNISENSTLEKLKRITEFSTFNTLLIPIFWRDEPCVPAI